MKAYDGKGAPASYTMVNVVSDDAELLCMAKQRRIAQLEDKSWTVSDWEDGPTWSADLSRLPERICTLVFGYGIRKVLEDRASQIDVGPAKLESYDRSFERFALGFWKAERQSQYRIDSVLVDALLELKPGVERAAVEAQLKTDRVRTSEFLETYPKVAPIYERLKTAAKTVTTVDFSSLLDDDEDDSQD